MLEDCTMEKKPSGRQVQAPIKGNGTESKKTQDVSSTKPFPKSSRRRESSGFSASKYDQTRKPIPQKSRNCDKRPKPKGQYYGGGKESTKVTDAEFAEYGSVFVQGSKKQNLNHLLNFHYAPRSGAVRSNDWCSGGGGRGSGKWLSTTHRHKYNKEHFLQANCQFVVKADADYTPYVTDPDTLVNWDLIEQIRVQSPEIISCPICLFPPIAAKMTRCGHVYCWSCILHYLALSDKPWRKCPICYESIHKKDLKSVTTLQQTQHSVGGTIRMRLMKRERGSLVVMPVNQHAVHHTEKPLYVTDTAVDTVYSKLLVAKPEDVMEILRQERSQLEWQLTEDSGSPEVCFTEQALELLVERESSLFLLKPFEKSRSEPNIKHELQSPNETFATGSPPVGISQYVRSEKTIVYKSAFDDEQLPPVPVGGGISDEASLSEKEDDASSHATTYEGTNRLRYESVSSEGCISDDGTAITAEDLEISTKASSNQNTATRPFYFYQASDGQHIHMHALNIRMLEHVYGSLDQCPEVVQGKIIEKESGSMTEELRQRLRYLQHLPVTCQFEVVELNLQPPMITRKTVDHFKDQIEMRRKRRQRRAREEKRREKRITEEENRRLGLFPTPHIRIESQYHFPQCGPQTSKRVTPNESSEGSSRSPSVMNLGALSSEVESLGISSPDMHTSDENINVQPSESSGPSFAQMLRDGKSKMPSNWPRASPAERKLVGSTPAKDLDQHADSNSESEMYTSAAPVFSQSFGDAIAMALEEAASGNGGTADLNAAPGKKKKKQKHKKVLFQTAMACTGK